MINITNNSAPRRIDLSKIALRPLVDDKVYSATIKSFEVRIARNGNEYVALTIQIEGEPSTRSRSVFDNEFGFLTAGLATQFGTDAAAADLLTQAASCPFQFIQRNEYDAERDTTYCNWYYNPKMF